MEFRIGRKSLAAAFALIALSMLTVVAPRAQAVDLSANTVTGGEIAIYTPLTVVQQLGQDRVFVAPLPPASLTFTLEEGPALHFPVNGGLVETSTMLGTINGTGGMKILKFSEDYSTITQQLDVTDPKITNGSTLLGNAQGLIPTPAADLVNPTHTYDPITGKLHFEADANVGAPTALVLNTYFNTTVFKAGMTLGHLKSNVDTSRVLSGGVL